jgi:DNA gyrase subunit A
MSKKNKVDFSQVAANVIKTPLETFVEDSYLPYAHYVIMSRALISDDGLKPVQRRILYAMDQLGLTDKKDYIKAAQIVGETMGKYHPHGDSSIGDALARMGQTFSMRVPLVDVQGSVGFTTGDDPAAPRYWEGRPTAAAMELTRDLKEGAVEMGLNYDGKFPEPSILPIKWPNGIINGSQGIAVGYSSNIVSHNPGEVMDAIIALIKNPDLSLKQLLKIMPGPDMATGGVLMQYEGVKEYYETGKGTFIIRGRYEITPGARGTHVITFNEAPYQVSAEQIVKAIDTNKKKGRLKEISYVKDLSDIDNGFKLSIGIKAGANPEVVLKDIFKWTPLQQNFPVNMNVLVNGIPTVLPMLDLLKGFIEFRSECIINKTRVRIEALDKQIERLSGIIAVLVDIDKAIKIIRGSKDDKVAKDKLQKTFKINEEQSEYILSMPLRRLTKSDSLSIKQQIKDLKEEHRYLSKLLKDDKVFNEYMIEELKETKKIIDDPRRTTINTMTEEEMKAEAVELKKAAARIAKNAECYITLFSNGTITRTIEPYKQERSPTGIITQIKTRTQEILIFVTRDGQGQKIPVSYIPENTIMDVAVSTGLPKNSVIGVGKETMDRQSHGILIITTKGGVNVVNGGYPVGDNFQITKLDDDETILSATWLDKSDREKSLVLISSEGYVLNFPVSQVRTSNSGAGTVRGMSIDAGVEIVGGSVANKETAEVVSCTHETIKVTLLKDIPSRNRSAKGVILQRLSKNDSIINAFASDKVIANKNGRSLRLPDVSARALTGTKRTGVDIELGHFEL